MKNVCLSILAGSTLLVAGSALSADLPARMPVKAPVVAPIFDWSGFYYGGSIGYNRHETKWWDLGSWVDGGVEKVVAHGAIFGLHAGYNRQSGNLVGGIETDISYSTAKKEVDWGGQTVVDTKARFIGTTRLRGGIAQDRTLYYLTGGVAYSNSKTLWIDSISGTWRWPGWNLGWVAGGGIEYVLNDPRWTFRLEGLYLDFGKYRAKDGVPSYPIDVEYTDIIVRAALTFKH